MLQGTDFVRGYPFSLREGVPTAVSHGVPSPHAASSIWQCTACGTCGHCTAHIHNSQFVPRPMQCPPWLHSNHHDQALMVFLMWAQGCG